MKISHNIWDDSSLQFLQWRALISRCASIPTEPTYIDDFQYEVPVLDYDSLVECNIYGEWDPLPEEILYVLLAHSDEEGIIEYTHADLLAQRLEDLLPEIAHVSHFTGSRQAYERLLTQKVIYGLRKAADSKENVYFYGGD